MKIPAWLIVSALSAVLKIALLFGLLLYVFGAIGIGDNGQGNF